MAKTSIDMKDLRSLTEEQLVEKVKESKLHLQSLRSKQAIGKLKVVQEISRERQKTAKLLTVLQEKAMLKEVHDGN